MKKATCLTDDQRWQSVLARDPNADGEFVFAVRTTGIFCRPSCRARHALRENVSFYANASEALAAGFRPCKRCQPDKANPRQHRLDKITHACRLLEQETPVTLEALADQVAMSPFHLHRLFKATTGMTPKAWQQAWRARRLRESLAKGESVTTSILNAGFPDSSSYYRKADETLGMTAKQFRHGGENLAVRYALADCELGRCLVAESERGICAILLGDDDATLISELQQMFPAADNAPADLMFQQQRLLLFYCFRNLFLCQSRQQTPEPVLRVSIIKSLFPGLHRWKGSQDQHLRMLIKDRFKGMLHMLISQCIGFLDHIVR